MNQQAAYLRFWGKASPELRDGEPAWHPLAYHCLDVAAVAERLLLCSPRKLAGIARILGTTPEAARQFLVALIALHDVGKFSADFQAKSETAWPESVLGARQTRRGEGRHDKIAWAMPRDQLELRQLLQPAIAEWSPGNLFELWDAVVGHHGQPVARGPHLRAEGMKPVCWSAGKLFCADVVRLLPQSDPLPLPDERALAVLSWCLAGLTVISDWIGSNRDWFPYTEPNLSLSEYWAKAQRQAATAVERAGVLPVPAPAETGPTALLPQIDAFTPLQKTVADIPLPEGPILAIISHRPLWQCLDMAGHCGALGG